MTEALPSAGRLNDERGSGPLAAGEWWLVDPVGGNANAVHGMPDWNIGVLARLTAAYLRTRLHPGDPAWQAACAALTTGPAPVGRVDSK